MINDIKFSSFKVLPYKMYSTCTEMYFIFSTLFEVLFSDRMVLRLTDGRVILRLT